MGIRDHSRCSSSGLTTMLSSMAGNELAAGFPMITTIEERDYCELLGRSRDKVGNISKINGLKMLSAASHELKIGVTMPANSPGNGGYNIFSKSLRSILCDIVLAKLLPNRILTVGMQQILSAVDADLKSHERDS